MPYYGNPSFEPITDAPRLEEIPDTVFSSEQEHLRERERERDLLHQYIGNNISILTVDDEVSI